MHVTFGGIRLSACEPFSVAGCLPVVSFARLSASLRAVFCAAFRVFSCLVPIQRLFRCCCHPI